jgi:hypothetical protein
MGRLSTFMARLLDYVDREPTRIYHFIVEEQKRIVGLVNEHIPPSPDRVSLLDAIDRDFHAETTPKPKPEPEPDIKLVPGPESSEAVPHIYEGKKDEYLEQMSQPRIPLGRDALVPGRTICGDLANVREALTKQGFLKT